ncbi:uncharacterized protein PAC_15173 [Phialocephala subalpina]|uniref:Uncharacterized protein n=1 Tax=Phialocephala subalpina TaxID=576137 RepID=A0A1L7XJT8_9HELO|nr:uncharacterized protein PAC_15173 [Phialocephala subalpina]
MRYPQIQCEMLTELMEILVTEDSRPATWKWLDGAVFEIERYTSREPHEIAEILLIFMITDDGWTEAWGSFILPVRDWRRRHSESITRRRRPEQIWRLCQTILKRQEQVKVKGNGFLLRVPWFGLVQAGDEKLCVQHNITGQNFITEQLTLFKEGRMEGLDLNKWGEMTRGQKKVRWK